MRLLSYLAVFAAQVAAQSQRDIDKYPAYAEGMARYGYSWEPIELTTDDGYLLTTFHITGNGNQASTILDEDRIPIVIMNGLGSDAESWLNWYDGIPMPL